MDWTLIAACNDHEVLRTSLLASPDVQTAGETIVQRGFHSASAAYNDGIRGSAGEIVVFAHQDVYLPPGWIDRLSESVAWLDARDQQWAVAGVFGVDADGVGKGRVYSTGLRSVVGQEIGCPVRVRALDEMVLILRRNAGLFFDEELPGFHFYGTDICLQAARRGYRSYALPCSCIHNSNGIRFLPWSYWKSYLYMRRKWRHELPIPTPCLTITRWCGSVMRYLVSTSFSLVRGRQEIGLRVANPAGLSDRLFGTKRS